MPTRIASIVVSKDDVVLVEGIREGDNLEVTADDTLKLQSGDRAAAYGLMHERVHARLLARDVEVVVVKGSAVTGQSAKLGLLLSAELRGVVLAAAAATRLPVVQPKKAGVSKTFGQRKVDEYVGDDDFWDAHVSGELRKGSREAVLNALAVDLP